MSQVIKKSGFLSSTSEFIRLLLIVFLIRTFIFGLYQVPSGSMETTMLIGERFFADKLSYWFRKPKPGEIIAFNAPEQFFDYAKNPVQRLFQMYVWGPANWTKRVIGVPGDIVRGTVEDGKPVVYVNNVKLQEDYLNKYPLICIWKEDPDLLRRAIEADIAGAQLRGVADQNFINKIIDRNLMGKTETRSYDPAFPFDQQPFYRMRADRVVRQADGSLDLRYPGTLIASYETTHEDKQGNHWNGTDDFYVELGKNQYWLMGDNRLGSKDSRVFGPIDGSFIHGRIIFRLWSIDSDESWAIIDLLKHPIGFWSKIRTNRFFGLLQ